MGRTFSLRGKVDVIDNQSTVNTLVMDYVSPDRTRAWKVIRAYVWPVHPVGPINDDDGFMILQAALATDEGKFNYLELSDPTDNRLFGWAQQTYNTRDGATNYITPNGVALGNMKMLLDPDHLITKELYINFANTSDTDVNKVRSWGWLIVLEEKKVTPAESLFQQIKGIGQDVGYA